MGNPLSCCSKHSQVSIATTDIMHYLPVINKEQSEWEIRQIDFYLPQLCLAFKENTEEVNVLKYLREIIREYEHMHLRIFWIFHGYYLEDNNFQNGKNLQIIEEYIKGSIIKSKELEYQNAYLNEYQRQLPERLVFFALQLKRIEKVQRMPILKENLDKLNSWMESWRDKIFQTPTKYKEYYKGVILPLSNEDLNNPIMIVNILVDESAIFETHTRTLIKIIFEVIKISEAIKWELNILPGSKLIQAGIQFGFHKLFMKHASVEYKESMKNVSQLTLKSQEETGRLRGIKDYVQMIIIEEETENQVQPDLMSFEKHRNLYYTTNNVIIDEEEKLIITPEGNTNMEREQELSLSNRLEGMEEPFGVSWAQQKETIRAQSRFKNFESYDLKCLLFKGGDDLRQELMAIQFIESLQDIFTEENIPIFMQPYEIVVTGCDSGYLEFVADTIALDSLKKKFPSDKEWNLDIFYQRYFYKKYEEAQKNFTESLAGYSILTYLLNIKDRHNSNILIHRDGRVIHIDFGFILTCHPGFIEFETAPFKLTKEYVEIMAGPSSLFFTYFKSLLLKGMRAAQKHQERLIAIITLMSEGSNFSCFHKSNEAILVLRERLNSNNFNSPEGMKYIEKLINESYDNWRTVQYDNYQKLTNGIHPQFIANIHIQ